MTSHEAATESCALPPGWQRLTLGAKCDILAGFGFPERFQGKSSGDLPFYKVGDISETWKRGDTFLTRANHYVSHAEARELRAKPLPANTTVFAKIGAAIALNRRAILSEPSLVDNNVMGLYPGSDELDYKFLFHFICTLKLDELSRATTVPSIRKSDVESIGIPIPPPDEQRRIVAEIEKQFTRLEAGVAALRRVQANLKRYRAAVLKAACEGRLVLTEAELQKSEGRGQKSKAKFETGAELLARILTERRQNWQGRGNYKEPAAPDATKLGPLPEAWTWATFEQISERVTVGFVGSMKHEYVENGVPFLRGQNVRENRFDPEGLLRVSPEFHQKLSKSALRPGDLAVVRSGAVGVTCVIPDSLPDANCSDLVLVQSPLGFVPKYGAYYMNSLAKRHVAAGKVGVALIHFNTKSVAALAVPLPPLAEQTRIVAEVERRLSVVEELESVVTANLQRATRLRQSILQKAFTGELTPYPKKIPCPRPSLMQRAKELAGWWIDDDIGHPRRPFDAEADIAVEPKDFSIRNLFGINRQDRALNIASCNLRLRDEPCFFMHTFLKLKSSGNGLGPNLEPLGESNEKLCLWERGRTVENGRPTETNFDPASESTTKNHMPPLTHSAGKLVEDQRPAPPAGIQKLNG